MRKGQVQDEKSEQNIQMVGLRPVRPNVRQSSCWGSNFLEAREERNG